MFKKLPIFLGRNYQNKKIPFIRLLEGNSYILELPELSLSLLPLCFSLFLSPIRNLTLFRLRRSQTLRDPSLFLSPNFPLRSLQSFFRFRSVFSFSLLKKPAQNFFQGFHVPLKTCFIPGKSLSGESYFDSCISSVSCVDLWLFGSREKQEDGNKYQE